MYDTSGIPQGSVLGPLLLLIYINDLPDVVHSFIKLFADDAKLYAGFWVISAHNKIGPCVNFGPCQFLLIATSAHKFCQPGFLLKRLYIVEKIFKIDK